MKWFFIIFLYPSLIFSSIDFNENLNFADFLFEKKEYNLSILEYKRLLYLYPSKSLENNLHIKIGRCLFKLKEDDSLFTFFNEYKVSSDTAKYLTGLASFRKQNFKLSFEMLKDITEVPLLPSNSKHLAVIIKAADLASLGLYDDALRIIDESFLPPDEDLFEAYVILKSRINYLKIKKEKSIILSGLLSIIPGLGLAYTGDLSKAATYFFAGTITFLAGWSSLSYRNWNKPSSRDIVDLSLWVAGTFIFLLRNGIEAIESAKEQNLKRKTAIYEMIMNDKNFDNLFYKYSDIFPPSFNLCFYF